VPQKTKPHRPRRKPIYHVRNWAEYDRALVERGSLTVWVAAEALQGWRYAGPPQRGAQFTFSDRAIECVLTVKEVFHLTNRSVEGFMASLFGLLQVRLPVPDHSTLSRRGKTVSVRLPKRARGPLHLVLDSSGLKLYGEGEWKVRQHGWAKRRTWRKFHLAVDSQTGEVQAAQLSRATVIDANVVAPLLNQIALPIASVAADGSYDRRQVYRAVQTHSPPATFVIPPRRDAKIRQHGNCLAPPLPRDEALRAIRAYGRAAWKRACGYHRRSLAETAIFRMKTLFDDHLRTRRLDTQASQLGARCRALNMMTHLGMPDSYRVN
jgi:Transposase DDE domain